MSELFLKVMNMSISASWLIMAVLICRLVLKKAPKWACVLLWGIVAARLLFPFSIESDLSLIPSAETISPEIMMDATPTIHTGIPAINNAVNPIISQSFAPSPAASANPLQIWIPVLSVVWIVGVAILLAYTAISFWFLRKKVDTAVLLRGNILQSENVSSPFVLGVIRPKIYLPFKIDEQDMDHVVAHELAHIRRRDHWWKPLGFLLLTVHWFNPLMWLAYVLLCRDIELACDEKVIKELSNEQRADYTQALLTCSVNRRMIAACPLAFGEVGVKERVKSVMNYRKPAFWVVVLAVLACGVVAVCFLTNPPAAPEFVMDGHNVSDLDPLNIVNRIMKIKNLDEGYNVYTNPINFELRLTSDFDWSISETIRFFYFKGRDTYCAQLRMFPDDNKFLVTDSIKWGEENSIFSLYHYLQALKYLPQEEISRMAPGADQYILRQMEPGTPDTFDRVITYTRNGSERIDGWQIHMEIQPMYERSEGGYHGVGDEAIHLFYEEKDAEAAPKLSLDDVTILSQKGHDLSWADFEKYDHIDTGSGLYIWKFEINELFTLLIGGGSTDTKIKPMYINLIANDGTDSYIDIRDGGVTGFIALHKDNPVVFKCGAWWQCSPVGYSEELFWKMVELYGVSYRFAMSSIQYLPVVRINNSEELQAITEILSSYGSLDYSPYSDVPAFTTAAEAYDDSFFASSTLFLIYVGEGTTAVRHSVGYVHLSNRILSIGIDRLDPGAGDTAMEGWLIAVAVSTDLIADADEIEARISSTVYVDS